LDYIKCINSRIIPKSKQTGTVLSTGRDNISMSLNDRQYEDVNLITPEKKMSNITKNRSNNTFVIVSSEKRAVEYLGEYLSNENKRLVLWDIDTISMKKKNRRTFISTCRLNVEKSGNKAHKMIKDHNRYVKEYLTCVVYEDMAS